MTWFLMVVAGFGCMVLMRWTNPKLDAVLIRLAAACFIGAGLIGVNGWLGEILRSVTGWLTHTTDQLGAAALGTVVVWIVALLLGATWVCAMLPHKAASVRFPDWLIVGGIFLPSLMTGVPGPLGDGLRTAMEMAGNAATQLVGSLLGVA